MSLGNVTLNAATSRAVPGLVTGTRGAFQGRELDTYPLGPASFLYSTVGPLLAGPIWTLTPWALPGGGLGTVLLLERLLSW